MQSNVFNRYVIKNLCVTTLFIAVTLAAIIMMTQSLKFLELIINAGASSKAFWMLVFLALPRFFEVILPIAFMIAGLFTYNRMIGDSEVIVMRAAGKSPLQMAKPALIFGLIVTLLLLLITTWLAPVSLSAMQKMRQVLKAQYSTLLFQEGVFNEVGKNLTVYINNRNDKGELEGLLIHDKRTENPAPVTIIAKRGVVVATDEGQQVLVYEGSRQDFNKKNGALNRLDFARYSIDLPESAAVKNKRKKPDERTFFELLNPNLQDSDKAKNRYVFIAEANKRIIGSLLPLTFIGVVLCFLLLGPINRRGQTYRIVAAIISILILQSLFLGGSNAAGNSIWGLVLLYLVVLVPLVFSIIALSFVGEKFIQLFLFNGKAHKEAHNTAGESV